MQPIRRRSPDRPVSPWPGRIFTVAVMVATFIAGVLWFPVDLADSVIDGVRSSASAAWE